ncbi:hypothetical protein L1987_33168 [Smallanthus sonchifolius]|uniref:Uncharacterized protein n=1 Tax=Smallanthus sonchifolius TaxID=185202 RepID=A0ACB9HPS1_9ASTR|nr:hypothetical protein L1987_33168 [Smallanthus sonchifolius]
MGISLGRIPIEEKRPSGKDAVVAECRSFYKNTIWIKRPFVLEFFRRVAEKKLSGRKFILNFLVGFFTVFGETNKNSVVNQGFLTSVKKGIDIREPRWCDYMIRWLNKSKSAWNPSTHFNGPLALLVLVVVNDIQERSKRESEQHTIEWVCKKHLKNIENYMRPGSQTIVEKKSKALKIKTKKESGKTILEDNLDSNTKQLVVAEEDDWYDAEEEEYLAICNEYKENEEHDFMISDSGNHLILPAVSQVWMNQCTPLEDDDKHNQKQAIDINEEDDDSSEAIELDHEEGQTVNDQVAEESAQEALNLQMVIVKDKTNVLKGNEECEFDNEELTNYFSCYIRCGRIPNSNMLGKKEKEWTGLLKKTYDCCVTYTEHINRKGAQEGNMDIEKGTNMITGVEENTMKTDEVVELEDNIVYMSRPDVSAVGWGVTEVNRLKEEVEIAKVTSDASVKERDMAMQRIEELESMLKQLKVERENEKNIEQLINVGLETNSDEKAEENQIEDWEFLYKMARFCIRRKDGSIFYLDQIKEVLGSSSRRYKKDDSVERGWNKYIKQRKLSNNIGVKNKETTDEVRTSDKDTSQKSHEGSHDEVVSKQWHEEEVQGKVFGKMAFEAPTFKLISQLTREGYKEVEPIHNQAEEESGEVDITKLIKENKILDAESEKTPAGSRISALNVHLHPQ